jgi:hypothetical protein
MVRIQAPKRRRRKGAGGESMVVKGGVQVKFRRRRKGAGGEEGGGELVVKKAEGSWW